MKDDIETITSLFDKDAPMDVRPIYGKSSKTWQSKYLQIFGQIHNDLLPNTILTMSQDFNDILKPTYKEMNTDDKGFDNKTKNGVEQDLLSYLTIKSYQHLLNNSSGNSSVENALLYPNVVGVTNLSLIKTIEDLQFKRAKEGAEPNYFLDNFIGTQYAGTDGNNTGLNIVKADTWRRLNKANKIDLQTSFAKLYGSLDTRAVAEDILHYMMVKEGLQLKYGSLMSAMSPFIMNKYLKNVGAVESALKGQVEFESVFGISKEDVMKEFKYGYLQSNIVGPLLRTYEASNLDDGVKFDPISTPNTLTITTESFDHVNAKEFVRVKTEIKGIDTYKLFRLLAKDDPSAKVTEYSQVSSMGSNQQFGGGFVGGPRLTYDQARKVGRGTTQNSLPEERAADPILDTELSPDEFAPLVEYPVDTNQGAIQDVNEVLNSESAIVNQTTDSVTVKADVDAAETNIADMAQIMAELSKNSDSLIFDETGNAIIEDTDMSIPEATEVQQQEQEKLELDLFASEEISEASSLVEWWDANVEGNSVALEKLSGENIKTLDDAIALYGDLFSQTEQGEQDIIERLKCLI